MLLSSLLWQLTLLLQVVSGLSISQDLENEVAAIEKRANTIAITGVPGRIRVRQEVRELSQKKNMWTLFLLAMHRYQNLPHNQKLSYYQIAGIHGVPRQDWDDVSQCGSCQGADGYCTHQSILFPGWHRAYLALFEQKFLKVAHYIANNWPKNQGPGRRAMQGAASNLRIPYWDWAAHPPGAHVLSEEFTQAKVTVDGPHGKETFWNPLFRYNIKDPSDLVYSSFNQWDITMRYPTANDQSAHTQIKKAIRAFDNIRPNIQDQIYNMFSTCSVYEQFSNDLQDTASDACSNSLEGIHNTIHTTSGGPAGGSVVAGHMTYLPEAAFDPIFWMHHANVDRLFAMWQTVHPNAWSGSQVAPHNTWTIAQGSTQDLNSPLTPFHRNRNGDFWTTNLVRDWTQFGYTYPEFQKSDGSKAAIQSVINKLYGPSASATAGTAKRDLGLDGIDLDMTPFKANNGSLFQYVANIRTPRFALGSTYWIYLFNGEPTTEDSSEFLVDPNLVGPIGVLAQDPSDNATMSSNLIGAYSIPLTRTLQAASRAGELADLNPFHAGPYLKQNLKWRIVNNEGEIIDPDTLEEFKVAVYSSTYTLPGEFELPMWSDFVPLTEATENKPGGAIVGSIIDGVSQLLPSRKGAQKSQEGEDCDSAS